MIQSRLPRWPDRDKVPPLEHGLRPRELLPTLADLNLDRREFAGVQTSLYALETKDG